MNPHITALIVALGAVSVPFALYGLWLYVENRPKPQPDELVEPTLHAWAETFLSDSPIFLDVARDVPAARTAVGFAIAVELEIVAAAVTRAIAASTKPNHGAADENG